MEPSWIGSRNTRIQRLRLVVEMREFGGLFTGLVVIVALGVGTFYQRHQHGAMMAGEQTIHHVARSHERQDHHS